MCIILYIWYNNVYNTVYGATMYIILLRIWCNNGMVYKYKRENVCITVVHTPDVGSPGEQRAGHCQTCSVPQRPCS